MANRDPVPILDVPYVLQSEELCGGAAVAMVMRFWGATGIYAESFSSLVDKSARGIKGQDLIRSLHERGWQAVSFNGDRHLIERSLEQRRPPIALIEVGPGRFHYVVVLSWGAGKVVVHDPARKPFDVREEAEFLRAWDRSGRWTLVAAPGTPAAAAAVPGSAAPSAPAPTAGVCGPAVDEAVSLARRGETAEARRVLEGATAQCPTEAAGWRELAGLDALTRDWASAAVNARRALMADGGDQHAARILATSLFLEGDTIGALRAWNQVGEPTLDFVEVRGLERTRMAVAMHALRLQPQTRLTPSALTRAARRLDALPALMGSRVTYTPKDDGLAQVTGAVVERPMLPVSTIAVIAAALHAGTDRELRVSAASLTGGGELWHAAWRWWEKRPRAAFGVAAPAPFGGIWQMSFVTERETYGSVAAPFQERRRTLSLSFTDWMTGTTRWDVGLAHERWPDGPATGVLAGVRYQTIDDRLSAAAGSDDLEPSWPRVGGVDQPRMAVAGPPRGPRAAGPGRRQPRQRGHATARMERSRVRTWPRRTAARAPAAARRRDSRRGVRARADQRGRGVAAMGRAVQAGAALRSGSVRRRRPGARRSRVRAIAAGTSTPALACAWPYLGPASCAAISPSACAMGSGRSRWGGCDSEIPSSKSQNPK